MNGLNSFEQNLQLFSVGANLPQCKAILFCEIRGIINEEWPACSGHFENCKIKRLSGTGYLA